MRRLHKVARCLETCLRGPPFKLLLGLLALVLILFPYPVPSYTEVLRGFDSNLVALDPRGNLPSQGKISLSHDLLVIDTVPQSQPTAHIITSFMPFKVQFDFEVSRKNGTVFPVQFQVWNPATKNAYGILFDANSSAIVAVYLEGGILVFQEVLGTYVVGQTYHATITAVIGKSVEYSLYHDNQEMKSLLSTGQILLEFRLSLSFFSTSFAGFATTTFSGLSVERQNLARYFSIYYANPVLSILYLGTVVSSVLFYLPSASRTLRSILRAIFRNARGIPKLLTASVLAILSVYIPLFGYGNLPFDMFSTRQWAYILASYGLGQFLPISFFTTSALIHGAPYQDIGYPYPPLLIPGYYFLGLVYRIMFSSSAFSDYQFEFLYKLALTAFLVTIVMVVTRGSSVQPSKKALAYSVFFALSPGIILDIAVWGQVDVILSLLLLCGSLFVLKNRPSPAFLFLGLALLTKQTALIPGAILGTIMIRRFGLRKSIEGSALIVTSWLILFTPFFLSGFSPAGLYLPTLNKASEFAAPVASADVAISRGALSIWTLGSALIGFKDQQIYWASDLYPVFGGLTIQNIGTILTIAMTGILALTVLRAPRTSLRKDVVMSAIAVACIIQAVLPTRADSRFLFFALLFLIMSALMAGPRRKRGLVFSIAAVSSSLFVGIFGALVLTAKVFHPDLMRNLLPEANFLNSAFLFLFLNNYTVALLSGLNLLALALSLRWYLTRIYEVP